MKNSTLICLTIISLFLVINLNQVSSKHLCSISFVSCNNNQRCCNGVDGAKEFCCLKTQTCNEKTRTCT
ncbi:hypothetical protein Mgra_00008156 [Meloidogyne graminicola]|uniref:Uncharacterized protein n=1 Tax=Meloidogyne graminicola TaxID=189291 RepID=A0A8S9ZGK9_9BILA|nr:hypothetical protein Mgra_00008156 [Meloidogyne graminicola]